MTDHEEIAGLLTGYALACLDSEDEEAVREHLAGCAECRSELAALRLSVGELAAAMAPCPPPAGLEERIMSALPRIRARPRLIPPFLAAAAAILIALLGAGNVLQWQRSQADSARRAAGGLVTMALLGSGAGSSAFGTIVLDPEDNEGVLAVRGLDSPGASGRYQLWLVKGERKASGGLFEVDSHGYGSLVLDVPADFRGFDALMVTLEPRGGSASPSGRAVMQGSR